MGKDYTLAADKQRVNFQSLQTRILASEVAALKSLGANCI
jgi:hypothetical protein